MAPLPLDHLVYAAPDLGEAVAELEERLGIRASPGGSHPGVGTRNALLALSRESYLEVIGPDPEQPTPEAPRPFGIDSLDQGRLLTWAVKATDLEARVESARHANYDPGPVRPMSRRHPDGTHLQWRLTLKPAPGGDGLVPFLIDWGATPSPALGAAPGASLIELRAEHPRPAVIEAMLKAVGVELQLQPGPQPALMAVLDTPRGRVELR